jgi:Ca2+-binding RTX toxin-like protein
LSVLEANTETKFWDDGNFAAVAKILPGVTEPTVPIFFQGALVGGVNYHAVELFDKTPNGAGYPSTFVDIVANTYVRNTYQKPDGMNKSGNYGTSFAATFSYRPAVGELKYIPTVDRADITIGGADRYTDVVTGHFDSVADTTSTRTFPDPTFAFTKVGVSNTLTVQQNVKLATGSVRDEGDVLRAGTLSSMFSSSQQFDASLILWEDKAGNVHSLQLSDATLRDKHLFDKPQELGSWVELVKGAGSTWYPDSPTIRLKISNPGSLQLGLQGFLVSSLNPNDDSLNVWTEVLNPPSTLAQGTNYKVDFEVIAVAPLTDNTTYVTPFSAKLAGTPFSNVTLSGTGNINAIGKDDNNVLKGNIGANTLDGGAGNDKTIGGAGNDKMMGGTGNDNLNGGAGNDKMIGGAGNDKMMGGTGNDNLNGGADNDNLNGGLGKDKLTGGTGKDSFQFDSKTQGVDIITDFASAPDTIRLKASGFGSGLTKGVLAQTQLVLGSAAEDKGDRIIYDSSTGALFFDKDGKGGSPQIQFATLQNKPTIVSAADFVLF